MAEHIVDTINYSDNGRVIRKDTWQDDSGQQWDTFTPVNGVDASALGQGTLVHPGEDVAQNAANQQYSQAVGSGMVNTGTTAFQPPQYVYSPIRPTGIPSNFVGTPATTPAYATPAQTAPGASVGNGAATDTSTGGSAVSVNPQNPLGPNPNPVIQPPNAQPSPGNSPSAGQVGGNQTLYNWDNPTQALLNSMRANGTAFNINNPTVQMLLRAAPGLASAFLIRGAQGNQQSTDYMGDFGSFLNDAVKQGNMPTILRQAQASLGDIMPQVRAYSQADQGGSPNPLASNTLLGSLTTMLSQNGQSGLLDVLNNLNTPLMNRSSASAYQNLLGGPGGLGSQATYNLGQGQSGGDLTKDFWYYLLGR